MNHQNLPEIESKRLRVLRDYEILDTAPEQCFDDITLLASQICGAPESGVAIVDESRLWFKSKVGFDLREVPRSGTFCTRAIEHAELLVVPNAVEDARFCRNTEVDRENGYRFYAGVPLINPEGYVLGTLFVMDTAPRDLTEKQKYSLVALARQVEAQFELRRKVKTLEKNIDQLEAYSTELLKSQERYRSVVDNVKEVIFQTDIDGRWLFLNPAWTEITGFAVEESLGENFLEFVHPQDRRLNIKKFAPLINREKDYCRHEIRYLTKNEGFRWIEVFAQLTFSETGKILGTSGTLNDITERKLAEQNLKKETAYVNLLQSATAAANEAETVEEAMQVCLDKICPQMGWEIGQVYFLNTEQTIRLVPAKIKFVTDEKRLGGFFEETANLSFNSAEDLPGQCYVKKKAIWSSDVGGQNWCARKKTVEKYGFVSGFAFPVTVGLEVCAVFEFFSEKTIEPDEKLLEVLSNVGVQLGRIVERKRAEEKNTRLINELADINLALDVSTIVAVTDRSGVITHVNDKFCEISGYEKEDLIGANHRLLNSGYHPPRFFGDLWESIVDGQIWNGEIRNRAKNGKFYWVDATIIPFLDDAGKPYQHISISIDITKRKIAEQQMRESEGRFRAISETSPLGIFLTDEDGACIYINNRFKQICGWTAEELLGWKWTQTVHPENLEKLARDWEKKGKNREYHFEYRLLKKDGTVIWANANSAPVLINGRTTGYVGMIEDITERKLMEQALRESEARYRIVAETASDAIITIDGENRILFVNSAAERIFGYQKEEIENQPLSMLLPDQARGGSAFEATPLVETGTKNTPWRGAEVSARHRDGREIVIEISFGEFIEDGRHIFTGIARDITERKRIAAELQQAKEDAEAATRAKSQFLANMSHEIRTPMNSIIGLSGLLLESNLTRDQQDLMETVSSSAESLLTIINDILDFSKIEAGKLELEILEFELGKTVKEIFNLFAQQSLRGNNRLDYRLAPELPEILEGDAGRLRQVLTNLISNAVKFTKNGRVWINSEIHRETEKTMVIYFEVVDTGVGISPEQQAHLFQPFTQADGSIKRRFGGTGLGLAICKQLVEMMNGEIGVRSAVGRGSTFWFTAEFGKIKTAPVQARFFHGEGANRLPAAANAEKNLRVLVADDNPVNRKVALLMLEKLGYRADFACSGLEVLRMLEEKTYDLILMDVQMPEMDGLEATRRICAKYKPERRPRIAAMTANAMSGDRDQCLAAGMDDYFSKPIRKQDLQTVLSRCEQITAGKIEAPPGAAFADVEVINEQIFHSLKDFAPDGAEEVFAELIAIFAEEAPKSLAVLARAIEMGDPQKIERAAHSLKGSCATIGAARAAAVCADLELRAYRREIGDETETLKIIGHHLDEAVRAFQKRLAVS